MHRCGHGANGNLASTGQNMRLRMGGMMLLVALGAAVALVQTDVARGWRMVLFVPFFLAAFGAWQGLYRTCPGMVNRGMREDERGDAEPIRRADDLRGVRRDAYKVLGGTVVTALAATLLVLLVP